MYKVFDLETQTHTYKRRKASPWHPDNYIVALGWKNQGDKQCSYTYNEGPVNQNLHIEEDCTLLIGFNLKFDLLWQWENPELQAFFERGGRIWDAQYAEYLLQGQDPRWHYPALTEVAPMYGGTTKIDEVKILWDQGVQTSDINKDLLIDYLIGTVEENRDGGDIGNTEKTFLGQLKRAKEMDMLTALWSRMDGLLATIEMEWNGLKIDVEEAKKQFVQLTAERKEASAELDQYIPELPPELEFNWNSNVHKSCLLFGGHVKYKKKSTYIDNKTGELARFVNKVRYYIGEDKEPIQPVPDVDDWQSIIPPTGTARFKGGKNKGLPKTKLVSEPGDLKTKYMEFTHPFKGYANALPEWRGKLKDGKGEAVYSVNGDVISAVAQTGVPFCEALGRLEDLNKEINTYFLSRDKQGNPTGMLTCVDTKDNCIHHSLNNTATVTSRLSSSDPNLQNVPRGDKSRVKALFVSRFEGGSMIEADYSQLEVVIQGVLSKDKQLCADLRNKIDFHCKRVAIQPAYNITYDKVLQIIKDEDHPDHAIWKNRRTKAKIFSFQRAYGAGAALIALSTGMDVDEVKELIAAEELTYPGVVLFNKAVEDSVKENAEPFYDPANEGTYHRGFWVAPTGCRYTFRSYPAKDWQLEKGITDSFNPTEMKNYPIQGTGGEVVQGICGKLWRHFVSKRNYDNRAVLCNTVHDCVWIDCHPDVKDEVAADVKKIMESVPEWFEQFGVKITVPFPVEVEAGPNMLELRHVC